MCSLGVPGLGLTRDWLSPEEASSLLLHVDQAPWREEGGRRVQLLGEPHGDGMREVGRARLLRPLLPWARALCERLAGDGRFLRQPDHVAVSELLPGQGMPQHKDPLESFGSTVASLCLGSAITITFRDAEQRNEVSIPLAPGSLLVLNERARSHWTHGVRALESELMGGDGAPGGRPVFITFRTVRSPDRPEEPEDPRFPGVEHHRALLDARLRQLDAPLRAGLHRLAQSRFHPAVDLVQFELVHDEAADAFPVRVFCKRRADGEDRYTHSQSYDPSRTVFVDPSSPQWVAGSPELVPEPVVHAALLPYYFNAGRGGGGLPDEVLASCDEYFHQATESWFLRAWSAAVGAGFPRPAYFLRMLDDVDDRAWDLRGARQCTWSAMYAPLPT
jgi:hypothetical protein